MTLSTTAALVNVAAKRETKDIDTFESATIRSRGVSLGDMIDETNTSGTAKESVRKSAYVCEDGLLRLACSDGRRIQLLRANFGRFSITLCNPSGFLDWSVNCASGNSRAVLHERLVSFDYKFNNNLFGASNSNCVPSALTIAPPTHC